jgi:solute carrier family 25 (mitochondrial carnitine/acylcarnitine transporter), member 20/29
MLAVFGSPIDYIKVQRQLEKVAASTATSPSSRGLNMLAWGRKIVKQNGYRGLYNGFSLHFLMDVIGTATYFGVYETFKKFASNTEAFNKSAKEGEVYTPPLWVTLVGGGLSGAISWLLVFPVDVVKSVLQKESLSLKAAQKRNRITFIAKSLYSSGGFKRFYKGIAPQMIRSFGVHAINFMVYEKVLAWCGGSLPLGPDISRR